QHPVRLRDGRRRQGHRPAHRSQLRRHQALYRPGVVAFRGGQEEDLRGQCPQGVSAAQGKDLRASPSPRPIVSSAPRSRCSQAPTTPRHPSPWDRDPILLQVPNRTAVSSWLLPPSPLATGSTNMSELPPVPYLGKGPVFLERCCSRDTP